MIKAMLAWLNGFINYSFWFGHEKLPAEEGIDPSSDLGFKTELTDKWFKVLSDSSFHGDQVFRDLFFISGASYESFRDFFEPIYIDAEDLNDMVGKVQLATGMLRGRSGSGKRDRSDWVEGIDDALSRLSSEVLRFESGSENILDVTPDDFTELGAQIAEVELTPEDVQNGYIDMPMIPTGSFDRDEISLEAVQNAVRGWRNRTDIPLDVQSSEVPLFEPQFISGVVVEAGVSERLVSMSGTALYDPEEEERDMAQLLRSEQELSELLDSIEYVVDEKEKTWGDWLEL